MLKHNIARCKTSNSPFAGTLTLDDVLRDVYAFLDAHPTETVILCMKAENSKDDVADVQSALYERIGTDPDRWYLKNEIPTLGEVRGKIVLATRFDDKLTVGSERCGLYFGWADQGDRTVLDDPTASSAINGRETLCVQDRYNYDVGRQDHAPSEPVSTAARRPMTRFPELHVHERQRRESGTRRNTPSDINLDLYAYEWEAGTAYGVVIVDFGPKKIAEKIYGTNFQ
ncbi:MAG: phosphatidylinositol-specific phospholipase C domain-containing protein [Oscillospiraceae bacterium]